MRDTLATVIYVVLNIYTILIIARVLSSWLPRVPSGHFYTVYVAVRTITDPYLDFFRRMLPPMGGFDLSPIIAVLVLQFGGGLIVTAIAT